MKHEMMTVEWVAEEDGELFVLIAGVRFNVRSLRAGRSAEDKAKLDELIQIFEQKDAKGAKAEGGA